MQKKIALVYYSQRGSTAKLAAKLAAALGVEPIVILEETPRNFDIEAGTGGLALAAAALAAKFGLKGRLKPVTAQIAARIAEADSVVLGTPVWADAVPPAVNAFVSGRLKAGATVYAFGTMSAPGADKALEALRKRIERRGGRIDEALFINWKELEAEATSSKVADFLSRIG